MTWGSTLLGRVDSAELGSWGGLNSWLDALVALQMQCDGRGGCPIANLVAQLGERDDENPCSSGFGIRPLGGQRSLWLIAMVASGELRQDADAV